MSELQKAQMILAEMEDSAALSQAPKADRPYHLVARKLRQVYNDLLPGGKASETSINRYTLADLATETYLADNFDKIKQYISQLRFPSIKKEVQLFLPNGGSYSLLDMNGVVTGFVEERVGEVYEGDAHNAAAYTMTKPAVLYALKALGRTMDISNNDNTDTIRRMLEFPVGKVVHMGGLLVDLPKSKSAELDHRYMVMGVSSVEITPEALQLIVDDFIAADAEDSLDHSTDNDKVFKPYHFTLAGSWDETAAKAAVAGLNGATQKEMQLVVDKDWARMRHLATALHLKPIGPQFH